MGEFAIGGADGRVRRKGEAVPISVGGEPSSVGRGLGRGDGCCDSCNGGGGGSGGAGGRSASLLWSSSSLPTKTSIPRSWIAAISCPGETGPPRDCMANGEVGVTAGRVH